MNIVSNKKAGIPKTRGTLPTYMYIRILYDIQNAVQANIQI